MSESTRPTSDECAVEYVATEYRTRISGSRRRKPQAVHAQCQLTTGAIACEGIAALTAGEIEVSSDTRLVPCIARFMRSLGEVTTDQSLNQPLLHTPDQMLPSSIDK